MLSIKGECTQQEKSVVCGPFSEQAAYTGAKGHLAFKASKFGPVSVEEWSQDWTVLPWFSSVHTQETLTLRNVAGALEQFDRVSLVELAQKQNMGEAVDAPVLPLIPVSLPRESVGLVVKDELGILWGEHMQRNYMDRLVANITPRYPIASGWKSFLSLSFYTKQKVRGAVKLQLPLGKTMVLDSPIKSLTACISLPEDAKYSLFFYIRNVNLEHPYLVKFEQTRSTYRTYFTTKGEQKICLRAHSLTQEVLDTAPLTVTFDYPWYGVYRKPIVAFCSLLFIVLTGKLILKGKNKN